MLQAALEFPIKSLWNSLFLIVKPKTTDDRRLFSMTSYHLTFIYFV